jgi:hypothetical protein
MRAKRRGENTAKRRNNEGRRRMAPRMPEPAVHVVQASTQKAATGKSLDDTIYAAG